MNLYKNNGGKNEKIEEFGVPKIAYIIGGVKAC